MPVDVILMILMHLSLRPRSANWMTYMDSSSLRGLASIFTVLASKGFSIESQFTGLHVPCFTERGLYARIDQDSETIELCLSRFSTPSFQQFLNIMAP